MSITLRQLRYFVSAAETGKLSAAASACNVTQSAITLSIKALEDQIGFALFERNAHGVVLSLEGQRYLGKAREILALVSSAAISSKHDEATLQRAGRIKIAATDTVMGYFLMPHLARFKARYPRVVVEVVELDRAKIESELMEGKLDLAVTLVSNIQQNFELISSVLVPSQRRLWLPSRHHLLNKQSISLRDVAKEPLIMLTVDEAADTAKTYWEHVGLSPMTAMKSANVEAVRTAVARGLGVAVLSDMVYRSWSLEGDRIEVRDLKERIPSMDVGLTWKLGATLSPLAQEFHDFLKNAYLGAAK